MRAFIRLSGVPVYTSASEPCHVVDGSQVQMVGLTSDSQVVESQLLFCGPQEEDGSTPREALLIASKATVTGPPGAGLVQVHTRFLMQPAQTSVPEEAVNLTVRVGLEWSPVANWIVRRSIGTI